MVDYQCFNLGGGIRGDLKAEGINKVFSFAMLKAFIASPTTRYLLWFRIGSYVKGKKQWMLLYPIIYMFYRHLQYKTGIQIRLGTKIGVGVRFVHFGQVVINGGTEVGHNCTIFHDVTIGSTSLGGRAPRLGDNVCLCAGAKILGDIQIGNNVLVGANAVVVKDVPDNAVVGGVPAVIISMEGTEKVRVWRR